VALFVGGAVGLWWETVKVREPNELLVGIFALMLGLNAAAQAKALWQRSLPPGGGPPSSAAERSPSLPPQ
jgi:hypothetical protein